MASQIDLSTIQNLHQLKLKQKKEIEDLKNASTKGKKGAAKSIKDQVKALQQVHEEQIRRFQSGDIGSEPTKSEQPKKDVLGELEDQLREFRVAGKKDKPTRASVRKEKKEAKDKARQEEIAEEVKNLPDPRKKENELLAKKLQPLNLAVKEIVSDGHCLYRAIADQLELRGNSIEIDTPIYLTLRKLTSDYMLQNREQFRPFVTNGEGEPLSDEEYKKYCNAITKTENIVWGGHSEIVALANVLNRQIVVHSAEGTPLEIEAEKKTGSKGKKGGQKSEVSTPLQISYHKFYYSLGEHYNSLIDTSSTHTKTKTSSASTQPKTKTSSAKGKQKKKEHVSSDDEEREDREVEE